VAVKSEKVEAKPGNAAKPAKPAKATKPQPTKIAVGQRGTLGARLRELIREGLDNAAIWEIVKKEYSLEDNKRGYVSGQRVYMAKRSL
jgi:hypothetical protein